MLLPPGFRATWLAVAATTLAATCLPAAFAVELVPGFSFEIRMTVEDYRKEVAALDPARIDPAKVEASPVPAYCTRLYSVTRGSPAEHAGLATGWRVTGLNGRDIWHHLQPLNPDDEGRRELDLVTPAGERKKISFEPGTMGFSVSNERRIEVAVLKLIPRGRWDRDMMIAAVTWSRGDHEFAESALRAAMNRGMPPDTVLYHYASLIALNRGNIPIARRLNGLVMKNFPAGAEIPRFYREGLREFGLATGDYDLFIRANEENDGLRSPAVLPELAKEWKQWNINLDRGSLLPVARKRQGPDLLEKCEKYIAPWQKGIDLFDFGPLKDARYVKQVSHGHFDRQSFAPPGAVRDMAWHVRFAFRETAPSDEQNFLFFALNDRQMKSDISRVGRNFYPDRAAAFLRIICSPAKHREVSVAIGPCRAEVEMTPHLAAMTAEEFGAFKKLVEAGDPASRKIKRRVHELSMIRIGGTAEILLNGRTLMRTPLNPLVEDLYPVFHSEGMSFAIDGMTVHAISGE
jgi:hypothetical protein